MIKNAQHSSTARDDHEMKYLHAKNMSSMYSDVAASEWPLGYEDPLTSTSFGTMDGRSLVKRCFITYVAKPAPTLPNPR